MTGRTWVYSDPHFYHQNICTFKRNDGSPLRPWDDAIQMTENMIAWYNELVDANDRVYILGDVAFSVPHMRNSVSRLKGRKVLVPGNHDPRPLRKYIDLFDDVRGYVVKPGFIMSHIPLHPESLNRWKLNIHGHTHANEMTHHVEDFDVDQTPYPDSRYFSACVEQTDFRPILLDDILKQRGLL